MNAFICLLVIVMMHSQANAAQTPEFRAPSSLPKIQIPKAGDAIAPRLDPPKGYKPVQVPSYIADAYMKFASAETAHDFQIYDIERRVNILENDREKYDRVDIDSLKETRTKAFVYLAVGSTLFAVVWGALATLFGFFLKSYIFPRLKVVWDRLGERPQYASYPMSEPVSLHASDGEQQTTNRKEDRNS